MALRTYATHRSDRHCGSAARLAGRAVQDDHGRADPGARPAPRGSTRPSPRAGPNARGSPSARASPRADAGRGGWRPRHPTSSPPSSAFASGACAGTSCGRFAPPSGGTAACTPRTAPRTRTTRRPTAAPAASTRGTRPTPRGASALTPDLVGGAVALWGQIELHAHGMRAQHAMVVALALPFSWGAKRRRIRAAAAAPGGPGRPGPPAQGRAALAHGDVIPRGMRPPDTTPNKRAAPGEPAPARLYAVADGYHERQRAAAGRPPHEGRRARGPRSGAPHPPRDRRHAGPAGRRGRLRLGRHRQRAGARA